MIVCVRARRGGKTTELARRALNAYLDGEKVVFLTINATEAQRVGRMLFPWGFPRQDVVSIGTAYRATVGQTIDKVFVDNADLINAEDLQYLRESVERMNAGFYVSMTGDGTI